MEDNLSENVAFCDASGKLNAQGREAFIQSFSGFLRAVGRVQLKQLVVVGVPGSDACFGGAASSGQPPVPALSRVWVRPAAAAVSPGSP